MHAKYFDSIFRKALHIIVIIPLRLNIQSEPFWISGTEIFWYR